MIKKAVLTLVVAIPLAWVASILFMAFNVSMYGMPYQKAYEAIVETENIDLALTKILSDAGRTSLMDLFKQDAFDVARAWHMAECGTNEFEAETALYTCGIYALLLHGRHAHTVQPDPEDKLMERVQQAFNADLLALLGTSYMAELGNDPWGAPYRFYIGPWPEGRGPILFREGLWTKRYSDRTEEELVEGYQPEGDALTVAVGGTMPRKQGFSAPSDMVVYIWSYGRNGVSDQPRYDPTHEYAPPVRQHYREDTPEEYFGGGDDINNWESYRSFNRFYK